MADTVKLVNKYLETSSVVHNKETDLQTYLENLNGKINTNIQNIKTNQTNIVSNKKNISAQANDISAIKTNNLLWEGAFYMHGTQTAWLSQKVSEQTNGIVLAWSGYSNGEAKNYNWVFTFVPKYWVTAFPGNGVFQVMGGTQGVAGMKYVYVFDNRITGNAENSNGTNKNFVLRYVIGV